MDRMDTALPSATPSASRLHDHGAVGHLRTRTAELGACTLLHDAALAFDELLVAARRHDLVEHPDVIRSLGAVVHSIASSITARTGRNVRHVADPGGQIGSVLLDRAAARFSTRVIGTDIGRRPCPPSVLATLHDARRSLSAAAADTRLAPPDASIVEE